MRQLCKKIISLPTAAQVSKRLFKKNQKVVFTNGCFDLLHPGHVQYLEQARRKGDFLIVALDTDISVRKLKGVGRPINDLKSRQTVVAALESVDAVISFGGSDPTLVIKKIKPMVLVKGGDWRPDQIKGSTEVLRWGGRVFSLPYVKGKSTTRIVKNIVENNEK